MIKRLNGLKKFAEEKPLSRSFLFLFCSLRYNYGSLLFGYRSDIVRISFAYHSHIVRISNSLFILCFSNISVSPEKEYDRQ